MNIMMIILMLLIWGFFIFSVNKKMNNYGWYTFLVTKLGLVSLVFILGGMNMMSPTFVLSYLILMELFLIIFIILFMN